MFQRSWVKLHTSAQASKPEKRSNLKYILLPKKVLTSWMNRRHWLSISSGYRKCRACADGLHALPPRKRARTEHWQRAAGQRRLADTSEKLAFDKSMMTHADITLAEKTESEDDLRECERTKCFWERLMRYFWCAHFDRELSDGLVDAAPPTTSVSSLLPSVISFRTHGFVPEKQMCALLSHKYEQALPSVH